MGEADSAEVLGSHAQIFSEAALGEPPDRAKQGPTEPPSRVVQLDGETDVAGFRRAARTLIAEGIAPDSIHWRFGEAGDGGLFDDAGSDAPHDTPHEPADDTASHLIKVPKAFVELTAAVALHSDPQRYALLYRLLWRLQHEPGLRHDPLDTDRMQADRMAHAVRHDLHKMKAFVRFRPIDRGAAPPLHVAWFEPGHHIVEAVSPFFAKRFAQLRWTILTPLRSVSWDGEQLAFGPGASKNEAPSADAGEALWLTYYEHIFNPARLKLRMMEKEMPRRYWKNLPEATLIQPLTASAHERNTTMIEQAPTEPLRKRRSTPAPEATASLTAIAGDAPAEQRVTALEATRTAARSCVNCPLYAQATQTVFGEGPVGAELMFVGEQPGDQEDLRGRPFVGPAGQLFDRALAELGVDRERVYITNAVKHFKFELRGKRRIHKSPAQQEAAACLDWLEREIDLVKPQAIVALGATAARSLLGRPVAVMRERGGWFDRSDGVKVLVTLHPSALLRMADEEREAEYRKWLGDLKVGARAPV